MRTQYDSDHRARDIYIFEVIWHFWVLVGIFYWWDSIEQILKEDKYFWNLILHVDSEYDTSNTRDKFARAQKVK